MHSSPVRSAAAAASIPTLATSARLALVATLAAALATTGCATGGAYGASGDDRLDSAVSESLGEVGEGVSVEELSKKRCDSHAERLAKALNEDLEDADRLAAYSDLYKDFKGRLDALALALKRNPDLEFAVSGAEGGPKVDLDSLYKGCVDSVATINEEFYKYLRELADMPTYSDVKGVKKARLPLNKLKEAITLLDPSDKNEMIEKVNAAEAVTKPARSAEDDEDEKAAAEMLKKKKAAGGK